MPPRKQLILRVNQKNISSEGKSDRLSCDGVFPVTDDPRNSPVLRFGVFEADLRTGELRKHGLKVKVQEKPFQVLTALLAHPSNVVTRQELRRSLWRDETFVDFDHSINIAVAKLRQALGDSATNPRFIETLSRHGYRWIAPIESRTRIPAPSGKTMLAVLPFDNMSGDPEQNYFSEGLTEEMITQLGRLNPRRLGIIARTTAMHYRGTSKRADQIGEELGVDYILEGSVRRAGGRVRITAQLIQARDQTHLWAETYDRRLADVLDIQRNVARRIARSLAMELLPAQQAVMSRSATRSIVAYEAYLKGRYFWNRRTEQGIAKAIEYFEQAIQADPGYAPAYAGVADAYDTLALYGGLPPRQARLRTEQAARRALQIDDRLAEAQTSLAFARILFDWDWQGGEQGFKSAIDLNPNHVTGHHWYGLFLAMMGRFGEALAEMDVTLKLDPLSLVMNSHKGWILYFARRFDEAAEQLHRALEIDPAFPVAKYFLGLVYLQGSRVEDAIREFEMASELSEGHPAPVAGLGQAHGLLGNRVAAHRVLDALHQLSSRRYVAPYFMACVHLALGEKDDALEWLEKAFEERSGWMALLKVDPAVDRLRSDPRFHGLVLRVGLPA